MASAIGTAEIERVVAQIVARFRPRRVILFGSHAYGQPTEESDVDLLVVTDTGELPLRTAARISAGIDHPFPLDILVRTPADLQAHLDDGSLFEREVVTKGVVLYEAQDDRMDRQGRR